MQYAVLLSGQEFIIENIPYYFAQQYFDKWFADLTILNELRGELYAKNHNELKIIYNLETGMVTLECAGASAHVKSFFSSNAFYHYTQPILQAIRWLSKLYLINQIYMQGDAEINKLIHNSRVLDDRTGKLHNDIQESNLDYLLISILHLVNPQKSVVQRVASFFTMQENSIGPRTEKQEAVHIGFLTLGVTKENVSDKVSSISHVNQWLDAVGAHTIKMSRG